MKQTVESVSLNDLKQRVEQVDSSEVATSENGCLLRR